MGEVCLSLSASQILNTSRSKYREYSMSMAQCYGVWDGGERLFSARGIREGRR